MLQKISIPNKCCSFKISIRQRILGGGNVSLFPHKSFTTLITIIIFLEHQIRLIRMISEGLCDIEDWSNDAEKSALHHRNKLHTLLNWNILQYYCFCCIFGQINTGEQKRLASKH